MILKLCGLEFVSTESAIEYLFGFRSTAPFYLVEVEDGTMKSKWEDAGYETSVFI
jgi:hypothetical protein